DEWMIGIEKSLDHLVFGIAEAGIVEAHALGKLAENIDIGFGFAGGREDGPRELEVIMAVGEVDIGVLEEGGGRQKEVGIIGGVGLELLEHYSEQVVAAQAFEDRVLIGRDGRGIGIVDD